MIRWKLIIKFKGLQIAQIKFIPWKEQTHRLRFGFGLAQVLSPKTELEETGFRVATYSLNQGQGFSFFRGILVIPRKKSNSLAYIRFRFGNGFRVWNRTGRNQVPSCYRSLEPRPSWVLKKQTIAAILDFTFYNSSLFFCCHDLFYSQ